MKRSDKNLQGVLKRLFPSASCEEMETARDRVLNRLHDQLPECIHAFRFSPGRLAKTESRRPIEQVYLRAIYLSRDGAYALEVFKKAEELAQKELNLGSFYVWTDRMERRGLISKEIKQHNGRVQGFLKITELGERVLAEAVPAEQEVIVSLGYFA